MTDEIKEYLTSYLISSIDKYKWILENESDELLKWCIENNNKIGISSFEIKNLILETEDIPYIKSCIENPNITLSSGGKTSLILKLGLIDPMFKDKTKYEEYIKQCIENSSLRLVSGDICDLLKEINDDGYKKKYIYNNKKLYLDSICMKYVIADLIFNYDANKEFIQTVLLDEKIPFAKSDRVELIIRTGDTEFIKQFLTNENDILGDKYSAERTYLAIAFGDNHLLKEHINMPKNMLTMKIPPELTYGIELEAESSVEDESSNYYRTKLLKRYDDDFDEVFYQPYKYILDWKIKDEYSMTNGIEFTSPILKNTYEDIESIYRMTNLMKQLRFHPTQDCGGHIHIGADYFDCVEDYKNLFEIWANSEKILYLISNKEGEYPREGIIGYAKSITREKVAKIENEFSKKDVFIEDAKEKQNEDKHYSLNILNIGKAFKNTIEFRIPNGTLEPKIILQNITLYARIMQTSKQITRITNKIKNGEQITEEEKRKIIYKEMLKREIPDDDNMKILMNLLFDDKEERTIYEKRYYANKDLFSYIDSIKSTKFPKLDYEQLNDKEDIMQEVENYSKNYEYR